MIQDDGMRGRRREGGREGGREGLAHYFSQVLNYPTIYSLPNDNPRSKVKVFFNNIQQFRSGQF